MGHAASMPQEVGKPCAPPFIMCTEPDSGDEGEELTTAEENAVLRALHHLQLAEATVQTTPQLLESFPLDLLAIMATRFDVDALKSLSCSCSKLRSLVRQAVREELVSSVGNLSTMLLEEDPVAEMMACVQKSSSPRDSIRLVGEQLFVLLDGRVSISDEDIDRLRLSRTAGTWFDGLPHLWEDDLDTHAQPLPRGESLLSDPVELLRRIQYFGDNMREIPDRHFRLLTLYLDPGIETQLREHSVLCAAIHRWLHAVHKHHFVVRASVGWAL